MANYGGGPLPNAATYGVSSYLASANDLIAAIHEHVGAGSTLGIDSLGNTFAPIAQLVLGITSSVRLPVTPINDPPPGLTGDPEIEPEVLEWGWLAPLGLQLAEYLLPHIFNALGTGNASSYYPMLGAVGQLLEGTDTVTGGDINALGDTLIPILTTIEGNTDRISSAPTADEVAAAVVPSLLTTPLATVEPDWPRYSLGDVLAEQIKHLISDAAGGIELWGCPWLTFDPAAFVWTEGVINPPVPNYSLDIHSIQPGDTLQSWLNSQLPGSNWESSAPGGPDRLWTGIFNESGGVGTATTGFPFTTAAPGSGRVTLVTSPHGVAWIELDSTGQLWVTSSLGSVAMGSAYGAGAAFAMQATEYVGSTFSRCLISDSSGHQIGVIPAVGLWPAGVACFAVTDGGYGSIAAIPNNVVGAQVTVPSSGAAPFMWCSLTREDFDRIKYYLYTPASGPPERSIRDDTRLLFALIPWQY